MSPPALRRLISSSPMRSLLLRSAMTRGLCSSPSSAAAVSPIANVGRGFRRFRTSHVLTFICAASASYSVACFYTGWIRMARVDREMNIERALRDIPSNWLEDKKKTNMWALDEQAEKEQEEREQMVREGELALNLVANMRALSQQTHKEEEGCEQIEREAELAANVATNLVALAYEMVQKLMKKEKESMANAQETHEKEEELKAITCLIQQIKEKEEELRKWLLDGEALEWLLRETLIYSFLGLSKKKLEALMEKGFDILEEGAEMKLSEKKLKELVLYCSEFLVWLKLYVCLYGLLDWIEVKDDDQTQV